MAETANEWRTFHLLYAPRCAIDTDTRQLGELLLAQKTFWEAVYFRDTDRSLSLLWVCSGDEQQVHLYLCAAQAPGASESSVQDILPVEYGWEASRESADELLAAIAHAHQCTAWSVADVVRRLQFSSLPHSQRRGPTPDASEASTGTTPSPSGDRLLIDRRNFAPFVNAVREPMTGAHVREWCVPILAEVLDLYPNARRVCEELQRNAPAVIGASFHRVSEDVIQSDTEEAALYGRALDEIGPMLANAGWSNTADIYRAYHRYLLGKSGLCHLTFRMAASTPTKAAALAHALTGRIGGMKTFAVRRSAEGLDGLLRPCLAREVVGNERGITRKWRGNAAPESNQAFADIERLLTEERIKIPDPKHEAFLQRMPYLYTLEEMHTLLRLPFGNEEEGLPGLETRPLPPFYSSAVRLQKIKQADEFVKPPTNQIRIGRVETSALRSTTAIDATARWHAIPRDDLCKHALIVGSTGSGKTVTTTFLLRELLRMPGPSPKMRSMPFLVIEPVKTEYADRLQHYIHPPAVLHRWQFEPSIKGSRTSFFAFDPMRLQDGVTVARHISYLKSCFEAAFPLEPWMALLLENSFVSYYTNDPKNGACGLKLFSKGGEAAHQVREGAIYPSFDTFAKYFLGHFLQKEFPPPKGSGDDWGQQQRQMFQRRFTSLTQGVLGESFRRADAIMRKNGPHWYDPIGWQRLLTEPTVIELDAIPDNEQKALVMAFLLTFLFERRQAEDQLARSKGEVDGPTRLRHVLIVEEAHRLLSNAAAHSGRGGEVAGKDSKAKAVELFVDMLAEIRAFGQGIVIVEQIPQKLVPEAIKNTNLKIMLRLTSEDDREYLGAAMNFNEEQRRFVTSLRAESGKSVQFVAFEENIDQPVLLTLPLDKGEHEKHLFDRYF